MKKENSAGNRDGSSKKAAKSEDRAPSPRAPRASFGRDFLKRNLLTLLLPVRKPVIAPVN